MRIVLSLILAAAAVDVARGASNLLSNASFDNKQDALAGWKFTYDKEGESWYFTNHERVKVEPQFAGRSGVLALAASKAEIYSPGQGTKVDSFPVPVKPGGRFKFSLTACSTGPGIRALVEGYQWRPGVKPHPSPTLAELRKCFRSEVLCFGGQKGGSISFVGKNWETAGFTFPAEKPSSLAVDKLAKMEFLVAHIVAIDGAPGTVYVDDVKLETTH